MAIEMDKLRKAKAVLQKMGQGVDPVSGAVIASDSFLQDPRIIRCLFYVPEVLDLVLDGTLQARNQKQPFVITPEEKARVRLPEGPIGINQFAKCVNEVTGVTSRKLSGMELNKHLKALGLLTEVDLQSGKKQTIAPPQSAQYGIHTERGEYNGTEYERVRYDERGKRFLLDNLERILEHDPGLLSGA